MKEVRIGLIGFGGMGSAHAKCITSGQVDGLRLNAICDIDEKKRKSAKEIYPDIEIFERYEDLITSGLVDSILIATPHYMHPTIGVCAFENSLNVLTEKPIAVSVTEAQRFIDKAKLSGKTFGIMFQWRMHPLFRKAREIIKEGRIGNIKRLVWIVTNWYRTQQYYDSGSWRATWNGEGGGVLLNQAPHNLDQIQWLCGIPVKISARCKEAHYHNITVEDDAVINGEFENGATFTFITSTGEYPGTNHLEISASKGSIIIENNSLKLITLDTDEEDYRYHSDRYETLPKYKTEIFEGTRTVDSYHREVLQNFTAAILNNEPLEVPGESGIGELYISNAAYLSSWEGKEISIPFASSKFDRYLEEKREHESSLELKRTVKENGPSEGYSNRWFVNW